MGSEVSVKGKRDREAQGLEKSWGICHRRNCEEECVGEEGREKLRDSDAEWGKLESQVGNSGDKENGRFNRPPK